jgi:hypothetical protein
MIPSGCATRTFAGGAWLGAAAALVLACSSSEPGSSPSDAGRPGNHALHFNGTTDYAQTGSAGFIATSSPQTISFWVLYSAETDAQAFVSNTQAVVSLQTDIESGLHVGIKNGEFAAWPEYEHPNALPLVSGSPLSALGGTWHHVAYVFDFVDGGKLNTLYVDGKESAAREGTPNNLTPVSSFLGCSEEYADFFAGDLDEIRVWNVARTAAEVVQEMNGEIGSREPHLVAYFDCNEIQDGTRLPDNSGNGNDATLGGGNPAYMPTLVPSDRPQPK